MSRRVTCGCGQSYAAREWERMPLVGIWAGVEMKNCTCGSTISTEIDPGPTGRIHAEVDHLCDLADACDAMLRRETMPEVTRNVIRQMRMSHLLRAVWLQSAEAKRMRRERDTESSELKAVG